jgi:hypothetical protein
MDIPCGLCEIRGANRSNLSFENQPKSIGVNAMDHSNGFSIKGIASPPHFIQRLVWVITGVRIDHRQLLPNSEVW